MLCNCANLLCIKPGLVKTCYNTNNLTSCDLVIACDLVNSMPIDLLTSAKILGLNISNDLKWNCHIDVIIKKAKKRLYCLSQLNRSSLGTRELLQFFCTCIRPPDHRVFVFPVCHDGLAIFPSTSPTILKKYKGELCGYHFSSFLKQ